MSLRLLFFGSVALFIGCSDEMDSSDRPIMQPEEEKELVVSVDNQSITKAPIESIFFPSGSEIGVYLRSMDGSYYDGIGYNNSKFTASGDESSQSWKVNANDAI